MGTQPGVLSLAMKSQRISMAALLLIIIGLCFSFLLMNITESAVYIKGIMEISGPDWTCWCKNEIIYDCVCKVEK